MADGNLYEAARRVITAGLGGDGSVFTPGRQVWTVETVQELVKRFVEHPLLGSETFITKLTTQLSDASPEAVQLAAELMYFHLLPPVDIGGPAKRALVQSVLAIADEPVAIPEDLAEALDGGFATVGTAYFTMRDRQLAFLIRFVDAWKRLSPEDRAADLADPWRFRAIADSIPIQSAYGQRFALLYLAFPDVFQPIVSRKHRGAILAIFAHQLGPNASGDEDRDLLAIRRTLSDAIGRPVDFYDQEVRPQWQPDASAAEPDAVRAWLVRGENVDGHDLVGDWLDHGYCSVSYNDLPELPARASRSELESLLGRARPDWNARQRSIHAGTLHRFLTQISENDLVVTVRGPRLYVGRVTGPAYWHASPDGLSNRRRDVDWHRFDPPLRRDQLSDTARDKLQGQMTVSDMGAATAEIMALLTGSGEDREESLDDRAIVDAPDVDTLIPAATANLAERCSIEAAWLDETLDLLREKRQLVLYGPPGTGKTFLAQELALHITEQTGGAFRLIQFHPSYAYEDFFEGFRPQGSEAGTITFSLEPGPFKLLAAEAARRPAAAFVLVVDEINRANLAKVFGELYFLLEYRGRSVSLQYSPAEEFHLPKNIFLIGTMNTADRSIALVDAAMRRRFAWQGLFPGEAPVSGMLRKWLRAHRLPVELADLLDSLNERIGERDSSVGPSYLMTATASTEARLARIWKHQILPLLEERHAGDGTDVAATYGLPSLRTGSRPSAPEVEVAELDEESGEPVG